MLDLQNTIKQKMSSENMIAVVQLLSCVDSLQLHGLQHSRFPCPSPFPGVCSTHVYWVGDAIQLSHPLLSPPPSIFPSIMVFSNESILCIRWPKYWSFSFSMNPSNEYSGLTSFRIYWFDIFAVQGTLKSHLQHNLKASIPWHSAFFTSNSHIHTWLLEKT